jgi:uncharacterized protein (DUF58 family)
VSGATPPRLVEGSAEALLRQLELAVTRRLDGMLHGDHRGLVPGAGSEPGEVRSYEPGDDVRRMDWSVTARTGHPHVRTPIADRELEMWVVADLSASLDFGTATCEKRDLAVAAVAAFGHLTARAGNRVGALVVHGSGTTRIPPRAGRDHLWALLHQVALVPRQDGGGPTDLGAALRTLDRLARRRGVVAVVSDFVGAPGWERPLRALAVRHDVVAVEVVDPRELSLPDVGVLALVDPETGRRLEVQTSDRRLRRRFEAAAAAQRAGTAAAVRGAGADHLVLRTDRSWLEDLVRFVDGRRRRRSAGPAGAPVATGPGAGAGR